MTANSPRSVTESASSTIDPDPQVSNGDLSAGFNLTRRLIRMRWTDS